MRLKKQPRKQLEEKLKERIERFGFCREKDEGRQLLYEFVTLGIDR